MYRVMTAADLVEWEASFLIDPWDEGRADLRNGILCSLTDACHRAKGQPQPPIHYMPYAERPKPKDNGPEMKKQFAKFLKCKLSDMGKNHG